MLEPQALPEVVDEFHHTKLHQKTSNMLTTRVLGLEDVNVEVPLATMCTVFPGTSLALIYAGQHKACSTKKYDNLLLEAYIIFHFRGLILCNAKRLQFNRNKKQEHRGTVQ